MITNIPHLFGYGRQARSTLFPERLNTQRQWALAAGDASVILFVCLVVLQGETSRIAAAIVAAAVICTVFWQCGLYKRSYAVFSRDEAYFAIAGVTLAAVPLGLVLCAVANVSLLSFALAMIFCAVGTSALRARLHLTRRAVEVQFAGRHTITAGAWHDRESFGYRISKRAFDVLTACVALVVFSPLLLLAAVSIAIESGSPVLFRQKRVGENGRAFHILKFRTMRVDAGPEWARPGDNRITGVGRWLRRTSLDELPQLFNVLRGEMSIVGPRPEMLSFAASFARDIPNYEQRHVVAPGITGWAQVYLKRNLEPADMPIVLQYDLLYVEYASVALDLAIILKTAVEVLFHRAV